MKVAETKYIKIEYVIPENKEEDSEIKKIIQEVKEEEAINPSDIKWEKVTNKNRKSNR